MKKFMNKSGREYINFAIPISEWKLQAQLFFMQHIADTCKN